MNYTTPKKDPPNIASEASERVGGKVEFMKYDMEDFMKQCVVRYRELCGVAYSKALEKAKTPYLDESKPEFDENPNNERFNEVMGQPNVDVDEEEGCLGEHAPAVLMKILYGARVARYDLLRPVQALASKITKWTKLCDRKLHRLVSYINETVQICLHAWVGDPIERIKMVLYCDADLASDRNDHKSTSGVFLCLMGPQTFVPIAAYCRKQTSVSKSTPEAEVVALHDGLTKQGIPGLVLWEEVKGQSVNLTVAEDNQAAVRIIISGKNPNMRYLSRTQRVDIARLNQFYEEKLFTFVDCPTEYQAANMMTKAICDSREWMRDLQTTGHFAPHHLGEIIKGSAAAPAERGVFQNSVFNKGLLRQVSNEAEDDRWPSWIDVNLSKREGDGNERVSCSSGGLKQERREFWLMTQGVAKPRRLRSSRRTETFLSCGVNSPADRAARLLPRENNQICLQ